MESFFTVVFGGMLMLILGIGMFKVGGYIWSVFGAKKVAQNITASLSDVSAKTLSSLGLGGDDDRYSAAEEEDVINAASGSLPQGQATKVGAKAYVVKDITTGETIVQDNSNKLLPIASLTKLVTAIIARKQIPESARITISQKVMNTYGNTADFTAGETFTAGDLLYPLLLVSSNDAAEAYAEYYGRSSFIREMNDFVQSIGAYRTSFADPSGLDPENVSTANDLALIIDWIRKNDPTILSITELKSKTVRSHTWVNPTHFLSWSYYVGGKNGYLPEADRTTAALFKIGSAGDTYAIIALGSESRDNDVIQLLKKIPK